MRARRSSFQMRSVEGMASKPFPRGCGGYLDSPRTILVGLILRVRSPRRHGPPGDPEVAHARHLPRLPTPSGLDGWRSHRGNVDSALVRIGRRRRIGVTVPYLLAAPRLLNGSDMIFNTGRRLAKLFSAWYQARVVEPPIPIPGFTVAMVWHPRNSQSCQHCWLRDQVLAIGRRMR